MLFIKENFKFFLRLIRDYWLSFYFDSYCLAKKFLFKKLFSTDNNIFIERLYFEVTNICNLRCRYCIYSKKTPEKFGIMSFEIFKKAIDEFNLAGGEIISFTPTIGEPLLDPGLISKIEYALHLPSIKKVYFYTNGTLLLKDENYKKLIDSGIHAIEISISAFDEQIFKKVQQSDLYSKTLEGIHKLLEYNARKGGKTTIRVNFRSPILPSKTLSSKDFQSYIKPFLGPKVSYTFLTTYDNWCGNIKKSDLMGIMSLKRINKFKYLPCVRTFDAAILFDGSVRLCACRIKDNEFDELVVGNIKKNSLKEIFYSSKAEKIRRSFFTGDIPRVCQNCSFYVPITQKFISKRLKKK